MKKLSWCIIIIGLIIICLYWFKLWPYYQLSDKQNPPHLDVTAQIGDFIGGVVGTVFSLVSVLLVIETINNQNKQYNRDRFIQTFYEMLKIHNETVSNLRYYLQDGTVVYSRNVFSPLIDSYRRTFNLVRVCTNNIMNRTHSGDVTLLQMQSYLQDTKQREVFEMKIAYGYFFLGSDMYHLKTKNEIENNIEEEIRSYLHSENIGINGNNVLLGHYYRHLFQIVAIVASTPLLSEFEKYTYLKQLRSQLDEQEQMLLYYNSMSELGKEWINKKEITDFSDLCLIARFRMIKNFPFNLPQVGLSPKKQFENEINYLKQNNIDFFEIT